MNFLTINPFFLKKKKKWIRQHAYIHIKDSQKRQQQIDLLLPDTLPAIYAKYRTLASKNLQHRLTNAFEIGKMQAMINDPTTLMADRARLIDLTTPYSSAWLQVFPARKELQLNEKQTEVAVRMRLGKPACEATQMSPNMCCPHCGVKLALDTYHPMYCLSNRNTLRARQHNDFNIGVLKQVIESSIGGKVSLEPNLYADKDHLAGARPDNLISLISSAQICTDTTIRYISSPSYLANGNALTPGKVLHEAEKVKVRRHLERATQAGYEYSTIALSCNGGVGRSALELYAKIQFEAENSIASNPLVSLVDRAIASGSLARAERKNAESMLSSAKSMTSSAIIETINRSGGAALNLQRARDDPETNVINHDRPPDIDPPPDIFMANPAVESMPLSASAEERDQELAWKNESESFANYLLKINPKSSVFFNLINYGAISVQRGNARAIISDLTLARIKHLNGSNVNCNTVLQSRLVD